MFHALAVPDAIKVDAGGDHPLRQRTSSTASLRALRLPLALDPAAHLLDTLATLVAFAHGAVELNPLVAIPLRTL